MNVVDPSWIAALLVSGIAAVHDAKTGHIPNWLVWLGLAAVGAGSAAALAAGDVLGALAHAARAALGFATCGAVPLLSFRLKALGGGDVKLLATVGALLGPRLGLELSFAAFVVAAAYWVLRAFRTGSAERTAIAFAPCLFIAAVALGASHWRTG